MSLQIWLPLNGDLHNQGLCNFNQIINTNPTWTDNGKIGKAMMSGSITMPASAAEQILNNQAFSFACWIYVAATAGSTTDRAMLFGTSGMSANNNRKFSIFQYPSCNDLHLSWMNNAASTTFAGGVWSGVFPTGKWTHLAITYQNPSGKIYINGIQHATFSGISNSSSFAYDTRLFENCPNNGRYLNDYRIYNHCLSDKEVEEIAKGLVLHYKLDNNGEGGKNLLLGTYNFANWYLQSRWTKDNNIATYIEGSKVWHDMDSPTIPWTDVQGKTLTISADIRSDDFNYTDGSGFSICFVRKASGPGATGYSTRRLECTPIHLTVNQITSEWKRYSATIANISDSSFNLTFNGGGGDWFGIYIWNYTNKSAQIKNIKLEIGNKATYYSQAPEDFGLNGTNISDSSGYNYDGLSNGIINLSTNTPRYNITSYFGEYNIPNIVLQDTSLLPALTNCTICWWGKYDTTKTLLLTGQSTSVYLAASNNNTFYHASAGTPIMYKNGIAGTYSCTAGTWDFYVLKNVNLSTWTTLKINGYSSGWPLKGYISDFRIYATELTDEQILELYNISASIDNKGNIHTRELVEI